MKLQINSDYNFLLNDQNAKVYCIRRTPNIVPMQGKLGGFEAMTMEGPIHSCGDHCPFFRINRNDKGIPVSVQISCGSMENQMPILAVTPVNAPVETKLHRT